MATTTISGGLFRERVASFRKSTSQSKQLFIDKRVEEFISQQKKRFFKNSVPTYDEAIVRLNKTVGTEGRAYEGFLTLDRQVKLAFEKIENRLNNYELLIELAIADSKLYSGDKSGPEELPNAFANQRFLNKSFVISEEDAKFLGF